MSDRFHVLLIGDTILNATYRAKPHQQTPNSMPFSYLNEDWLELVPGSPEYSIQGIGYVANYLAQAANNVELTLWTGLGQGANSLRLRELLTSRLSASSRYDLTGPHTFSVTRVLRDLSPKRIRGDDPNYRPQLRMDTPASKTVDFRNLIQHLAELASPRTVCLFRVSSPAFFSGPSQEEVLEILQAFQLSLQKCQAKLLLDIRPIPAGLRILESTTIIGTTIGRLQELQQHDARLPRTVAQPEDLVEAAFWAFSPVEALYCFAADSGTIVCGRNSESGATSKLVVETYWPRRDPDGCGAVVAGDAWEGALLAALLNGGNLTDMASHASAALSIAMGQQIGASVDPGEVVRRACTYEIRSKELKSERLERLEKIEQLVLEGTPLEFCPGLTAPPNGKLRKALDELYEFLVGWRPRKGRDLIAVFGESRCGKEYIIKKVLENLGWTHVGPVNMHQFLSEVRGCLNTLIRLFGEPAKRALIIDEVTPGDSARSLLNLLGEKVHRSYFTNDPDIDFSNHPVILLSSIPITMLLDDLRGRLSRGNGIVIPPLGERWDEIPFLLGRIFAKLRGEGTLDKRAIAVSKRAMTALLYHDYHPRPVSNPDLLDAGLDQRNFRALEDLIWWIALRQRSENPGDHALRIKTKDLPAPIAAIASVRAPDDAYFIYSADDHINIVDPV